MWIFLHSFAISIYFVSQLKRAHKCLRSHHEYFGQRTASNLFTTVSRIHKDSPNSVTSAYDLLAPPHTDSSTLKGDYVELPPIRESKNGVVEFDMPPSDRYVDLSQSFITVQAKVTTSAGADLSDTDADVKMLPISYMLHSLFQTMLLSINQKEVEFEGNYPCRAYMEGLLNFGKASKETDMAAAGWMQDSLEGLNTNACQPGQLGRILQNING